MFLAALIILGFLLWENLPGEPIGMGLISGPENEALNVVDYGTTPVFRENLRFSSSEVSYYIERSCPLARQKRMNEAIGIFEREMRLITLHEKSFSEAQILIGCSNDYIEVGERLFAAGEGGPSQIINTSNFKIIVNGKISLYKESDCEYPVVEIHELAHVFGFDHSENPKSIMYNISRCDQRITPDMSRIMIDLYSIVPLPDLEIEELTAVKRGKYIDYKITVANNGLLNAYDVSLSLSDGEEIFNTVQLEDIGVGYGRILKVENMKLPSRNTDEILFIVDSLDRIQEINEDNNQKTLTASTQ